MIIPIQPNRNTRIGGAPLTGNRTLLKPLIQTEANGQSTHANASRRRTPSHLRFGSASSSPRRLGHPVRVWRFSSRYQFAISTQSSPGTSFMPIRQPPRPLCRQLLPAETKSLVHRTPALSVVLPEHPQQPLRTKTFCCPRQQDRAKASATVIGINPQILNRTLTHQAQALIVPTANGDQILGHDIDRARSPREQNQHRQSRISRKQPSRRPRHGNTFASNSQRKLLYFAIA